MVLNYLEQIIENYLAKRIGDTIKEYTLQSLNPDRVQIKDSEYLKLGHLLHNYGITKKRSLSEIVEIGKFVMLEIGWDAAAGSYTNEEHTEKFFANIPKLTYEILEDAIIRYRVMPLSKRYQIIEGMSQAPSLK